MAALPRISAELLVRGQLSPKLPEFPDASVLRELGTILHNIQCGVDARKLFRQDKRTKPTKDGSRLAFVYYYMRACAPDFSETAALACIKASQQLNAPKADASIKKTAQLHRDETLKALAKMSAAEAGEMLLIYAFNYDLAAWREEWRITPAKVDGLREYLRRKTEREPRQRG